MSLIEILIVIVILAILAAAIIPQFGDTSSDARQSSLDYTLHELRKQIDRYRLEHDGAAPTVQSASLPQLLSASNKAGQTGPPGSSYPLGPYLYGDAFPKNPLTDSSEVRAVNTWPPAASNPNGGWLYHEATGQIVPDLPEYVGS